MSTTLSKCYDSKILTLGRGVGGGLNGYDDHFPHEITTLHWFNYLVNLIHQYAPTAKLIFVHSPDSLVDGIQRILDEDYN
ncbi:unnamed protein product [Rotaria socialis]|uniref:Uncharacterized protein n=1 Tax=Rotaria socialis TaxID=392032 RepID=A0A818GUI4_9BILA|nr:unnamed protein product [Rotaria socialis]CAF4205531.1 unnamed protein product [Rotaria socialis]